MWYYILNEQQFGPVNEDEFDALILNGTILRQTPVWKQGMDNWHTVEQIPELAAKIPLTGHPAGPNSPTLNYGNTYAPVYVPDYLIWSVLELLFCCMPFGIVSLVLSIQANSLKQKGQFEQALNEAKNAKKFLLWGVGLSGGLIILYFVFMVFLAIVSSL